MPDSDLRHLRTLMTPFGIVEHSDGCVPRWETGVCLDDVSRLLVLASREPASRELSEWAALCIDYIEQAHQGGSTFADRRAVNGRWVGDLAGDDTRGRALWGLGSAAAGLGDRFLRQRARRLFEISADFRSPHPRSMAFAILGAGELLSVDPESVYARHLVFETALDVRSTLESSRDWDGMNHDWPWPEDELTYANSVIPSMMMILGRETSDTRLANRGIGLLSWLAETETHQRGHLSPTPTSGRSRGHREPGFDQQPIEVSSLADAGAIAWDLSGDARWVDLLRNCVSWFEGHNDNRIPMVNPRTGGGYDGLTRSGVNLNQGAESTLAMLTTLQYRSHPSVAGTLTSTAAKPA